MATNLSESPIRPITGNYLVDISTENIERLRTGDVTPSVSNAIVNNTSVLLRLFKMQWDVAKQTGVMPDFPLLFAGGKPEEVKAKLEE